MDRSMNQLSTIQRQTAVGTAVDTRGYPSLIMGGYVQSIQPTLVGNVIHVWILIWRSNRAYILGQSGK